MARVLIVEDEPRMRGLIEQVLAPDRYETVTAGDGITALALATQSQVDAAIVDVGLPGMDGFEFCRHLRKHEVKIGVLLLTARGGLTDRVTGLDSGADDYLAKPFEAVELRARLRALLRRQQRMPAVLTVGDLQIDPLAARARCRDRPLALSMKEFALLRTLAADAGSVVARSALLAEVWGPPELFDPSVVDQYVSYVRKKLAASGTTAVISTVRGVGYRLDGGE
ncbi:MAG TPA: response regulator transcription factor [Amnibacterium sp.]|nr:response regulator transcription factor [Amnibacterium sp.]